MTTTLTDQRADLQQQAEAARAKRPRLALATARGDVVARAELDLLDATLTQIGRDLDVLDLAEQEAGREAAVDAQERQAEEHRRIAAAIDEAEAQKLAAYRRVESTLAELLTHTQAAAAAGDEIDRLSGLLGNRGVTAAGYAARSGIASRIAIRFWTVIGPHYLPASGPDRSLVEGDPS